jgi:PKD repeat protein
MKKPILSLIFVIISSLLFSQTGIDRKTITKNYKRRLLLDFAKEKSKQAKLEKQKALSLSRKNAWLVYKDEDGSFKELMKVSEAGTPIYNTTYNVNASRSTRANTLNSGGLLGLSLNGQNMTAHIWDAGLALSSHQEYDGPGGSNRFSIGDGSSGLHYHSAHVTGTIIASGVSSSAKGMAPYAYAVGYEWNNDVSEATTAATNGMLLSNHSYGWDVSSLPDWYFGAYVSESRDWDVLMYNAPYYLMVVSAGNEGDNNTCNGNPLDGNSYYDKLSGHATSKNNLVVANAQDANVNSNGDLVSVSINSGSSEGPTDDYRIKPDIAGNGTSLYSTFEGSSSEYGYLTGTSMASPNVTGTLLLLQQHYHNINSTYMKAATLKGLALHTADDAGPSGPDAVWGWGLMNGKDAANAISNNGVESLIEEHTLNQGNTFTTTVTADGSLPLEVSICWTDPAGTANGGSANNTTPVLVNDLDLRVTQGGSTYYPYRLTSITTNGTGDNVVDPYEKVAVNSASGVYTITVTHKGSLSGGSQDFSLIITGKGPDDCTAVTPSNLTASDITGTTALLSWDDVPGASYDVRYRINGSAGWSELSSGSESLTLSGLSLSTQYEVQVRSVCPDLSTSAYSSSIYFTTASVASSSATYTFGDISTDRNFTGASGSSSCPGTLTVTIPDEATITRVDVSYTMTAINNAWKSEQRSQLRCVSAGGTSESSLYAGSGNLEGTYSYSRTNLSIANGVNGGGDIHFELHAGRTWGGSDCGTSYNKVDNNSWTIRVYYTIPVPVADFDADILVPSIGQNVSFTDASLYSPTSWAWSFSPNTVTFTGGTSVNSQNPQLTFNAAGDYTVSLTATNSSGDDTEVKTDYIHVVNCSYCSSNSNNASEEWISNVTFNTINNSINSTDGYEDFTSISTTIAKGNTYNLSVSCDQAGSWTEHIWAFFDWNNDCDFTDPNEAYDLGQVSAPGTRTINIIVPSTAVVDISRMRISLKYNGDPTPCEVFNFGQVEDYTIEIQGAWVEHLDMKIFLEGPFDGANMSTSINDLLPLNQPFNVSPWNYNGTESVAAIPNSNIVDWVLVDLRDAPSVETATQATSIVRQAAFLRNDGRIVDLSGNIILDFNIMIDNNLYVAVFQRNHIPVITASSPVKIASVYNYNFTDAANKVYGGDNGHKNLGGGKWGMFSGNGNADNTIDMNDHNPVWSDNAAKRGYFYGDYNLDSQVDNKDKDEFWYPNQGKNSHVPN